MAVGNAIIYNDRGEQIGTMPGYTAGGGAGLGEYTQYLQNLARPLGDANLANRVNQMWNPTTGQIIGQPRTPAEAAALQAKAEQFAAQKAQDARNQAMGLLGGARPGTTWGSSGTGAATDALSPIRNKFMSGLTSIMDNPGMSDETVQKIVSRGSDEINAGNKNNQADMLDLALSSGARDRGDTAYGVQKLNDQAMRQRAGLGRDVRIAAEQDKSQQRIQGLGVAGNYLGRAEDTARQDRNQLMELLLNQKFETPNLSNLSSQAGLGFGGFANVTPQSGGGANSGGGYGTLGSASGNNNARPAFQPMQASVTATPQAPITNNTILPPQPVQGPALNPPEPADEEAQPRATARPGGNQGAGRAPAARPVALHSNKPGESTLERYGSIPSRGSAPAQKQNGLANYSMDPWAMTQAPVQAVGKLQQRAVDFANSLIGGVGKIVGGGKGIPKKPPAVGLADVGNSYNVGY